jgi:hypothetical protein
MKEIKIINERLADKDNGQGYFVVLGEKGVEYDCRCLAKSSQS